MNMSKYGKEFDRGNEILLNNQRIREGEFGKMKRKEIADLRAEADKLDSSSVRGLNVRESLALVAKIDEMRQQADDMEARLNNGGYTLEMQSYNMQADGRAAAEFGDIQAKLLGETDARQKIISDMVDSSYNVLIGVDRRDLMRQAATLLDGKGATDDNGNKYVDFSPGAGHGTYRAVLSAKSGKLGFVMASRPTVNEHGQIDGSGEGGGE